MKATDFLPIVSVLSLITVEFGGWALLGFLTGRGSLGEERSSSTTGCASSAPATRMLES